MQNVIYIVIFSLYKYQIGKLSGLPI